MICIVGSPTSGFAVSIYLLAVLYAPTESPLSVLYLILTRGVPQNLTFFIPLPLSSSSAQCSPAWSG